MIQQTYVIDFSCFCFWNLPLKVFLNSFTTRKAVACLQYYIWLMFQSVNQSVLIKYLRVDCQDFNTCFFLQKHHPHCCWNHWLLHRSPEGLVIRFHQLFLNSSIQGYFRSYIRVLRLEIRLVLRCLIQNIYIHLHLKEALIDFQCHRQCLIRRPLQIHQLHQGLSHHPKRHRYIQEYLRCLPVLHLEVLQILLCLAYFVWLGVCSHLQGLHEMIRRSLELLVNFVHLIHSFHHLQRRNRLLYLSRYLQGHFRYHTCKLVGKKVANLANRHQLVSS